MRRGGVVTVLAVAVLCAVLATPLVQVPGVAATSVGTNDVVEVDIRSGGSIHDAGGVASGEADAATSTEVKADSGKRTGKKRRRKGKKKKKKKRRRRKKPMHLGSDTLVRTEEMDENGNFPSMTAGGRKKMPPSAILVACGSRKPVSRGREGETLEPPLVLQADDPFVDAEFVRVRPNSPRETLS